MRKKIQQELGEEDYITSEKEKKKRERRARNKRDTKVGSRHRGGAGSTQKTSEILHTPRPRVRVDGNKIPRVSSSPRATRSSHRSRLDSPPRSPPRLAMAMDDLAGSSSSSSAMDAVVADPSHGWQKVTYPKRHRKQGAAALPSAAAPDLGFLPNGGGKVNVFEAVDRNAEKRHRALLAARDAADPDAARIAAATASAYSDDDDSSDEAQATRPEGEVKKPKVKKPKKPKVTVAEAAALIDAENLAAHLVQISVIPVLFRGIPLRKSSDLDLFGLDHIFVFLLRIGSDEGLVLDRSGFFKIPTKCWVSTSFRLRWRKILVVPESWDLLDVKTRDLGILESMGVLVQLLDLLTCHSSFLFCSADSNPLFCVQESYENQQDIQLMRFADYFGRSFASVSAAQFPWAKMFKESLVSKMVDVSY